MTNIETMMQELYDAIEWIRTNEEMTQTAVNRMLSNCIVRGIRHMFVKTARAQAYTNYSYTYGTNGLPVSFNYDMPVDEYELVMLYARIEFLNKKRTETHDMVGYTTNALSVTHADKPFPNITLEINELEKKANEIFVGMVRYTHL